MRAGVRLVLGLGELGGAPFAKEAKLAVAADHQVGDYDWVGWGSGGVDRGGGRGAGTLADGGDAGLANRAEGGAGEEVGVDAGGVVDVLAGEGADGGFAGDVVVEADGARGLVVVLGGGDCGVGFLRGWGEGVEGEGGLLVVGSVEDEGEGVDFGLGEAAGFGEAEGFEVDFAG